MNDFFKFVTSSNVLSVILLVLTLIELFQSRKSRNGELLYSIFIDIHRTEFLNDIDWLTDYMNKLKKQEKFYYDTLDPKDKRRIDNVIDVFTRIAYLCENHIVSRKHILNMYSGLIIQIWDLCKDYIAKKRRRTGIQNYACYFETMYKKAADFRKKKSLGKPR